MNDFKEYKFSELTRPDSLRLIKLEPAPNPAEGKLVCELIEHPLDTRQRYEALSWSWGKDDLLTQPLYINKPGRGNNKIVTQFMITPHLGGSLRALRYTNQPRYIWIDAICIDQKNIKERNNQVPLMDQIYGNATKVCIWLGESDEKSVKALKFIRTIVQRLWDFEELCNNKDLAPDWEALISLMRRKWFSRRWVLQEIALAKAGDVYCGRDCVSWQDFADAVSLFKEVESATHRLSEIMKLDQKYHHVPQFFGEVPYLGAALLVDATSNLFRKTEKGRREPLSSLEYLVSKFGVFEATQPRDVVYALLAISKDTTIKSTSEEDFPELDNPAVVKLIAWGRRNIASRIFVVDYSRPIVDVYKDFIEFSIRKADPTRALDIICRPWAIPVTAESDRAGMTVPVWIPSLQDAAFQWTTHPTKEVGRQMTRHNADPFVGLPNTQRNYQAAGTRRITSIRRRFIHRKSYNSMMVHGLVVGYVKTKYEVSRNGGLPTRWLEPARWGDPRKEDPPEDFWRTLVADRGPNGENPPPYYRRACKECFVTDPSRNPRHDGNPLNTQKLIDEGRCSTIAEFLRRVQAVIWNRCLMHTGSDQLGLLPEKAVEGDLICILFGCTTPAPLPETDTHRYYYQVIGECYVHGMMNGEGLEIQNEMEIKRTVFELR
ncbi:heterokaryon incompatibility protein-domain-containing protein [Hyaloscypha sp. PMI_1271]|nr:heterokaryon incompatibility protein-domain-containing protein [Hyaloscypha sp. PMI_1271]